MNTEQLSMLEVAIELMKQKQTPQLMTSIIKEVLEIKGFDDPNGQYATQLYIDITTSSDFVFVGDGKWDLKEKQPLEKFDLDGSAFNPKQEATSDDETANEDEDTYDSEEDDEYRDDEDEDDDEDDEEYDDEYDDSLDEIDPNEDDDTPDYLDEEKYNDIMDDYEDMYDDN